MKNNFLILVLLILLSALPACGGSGSSATGGSEFGNPTRGLTGIVTSGAGGALTKALTSSCPADSVIATNSTAETTSVAVNDDCSFDLSLETEMAYVLSFTQGSQFVATLIVDNNTGLLNTQTIYLAPGDTTVDLGTIVISNGQATPEHQPAEQNDRDGDGINDFDDDDDDDDGISDVDETDCDLDGFEDDDDSDNSTCGSGSGGGSSGGSGGASDTSIIQVSPSDGAEHVLLTEQISVRLNCPVDQSTVTNDTFNVSSETDTLLCDFNFSDSGQTIECRHDSQDFLSDTEYSVVIDGITCEDGTPIAARDWSWSTQSSGSGDD